MRIRILPDDMLSGVLNNRTLEYDRYSALAKGEYYLHVSDVMKVAKSTEFCPRQYVLSYIADKSRSIRQLTPGMEFLFASGNALHDLVRNKFMALSPLGKFAYGQWECACKKTSVTGLLDKDATCPHCGTTVNNYEELTVIDTEHRIVGHPDFLLLIDGVIHIVEVKSLDRKDIDFDNDFNAPLGDHVLQATFYYWILRRMGYRVSPNLRILYADRNLRKMFGGRVYKEFVRKASPETRLNQFYRRARIVRESFAEGVLPGRICPEQVCSRSKNCNQAVTCFARESSSYAIDRD